MNRTARILTVLHALTAVWLAFCAINTRGYVPLWSSLAMTAASVTPLIAIVRESLLAEEPRPSAAADEETAAAVRAALVDFRDGCCDRWFTSLGTECDDTCQRRRAARRHPPHPDAPHDAA